MTKLDHVVAALAAKNRKVEAPDLTPVLDELLSSMLARQTAQGEHERRLRVALKDLEKNIGGMVNAIPPTDLSGVLAAVKSIGPAINQAIAAIQFPEVKFPAPTDLTPVLQQVGALADKFDAFHVDMPEVSVNVPEQKAVTVVAPSAPTKWVHKVVRGPSGSIREIISTAEDVNGG